MQTLWKLSQDGLSASRTLDGGSFESRLVGSIPTDELATAETYIKPQAEIHAELVAAAQALLDKSDAVATRCIKANVPYPAEWYAVDIANRAIVSGKDAISTKPVALPVAYPSGT
jgi:hypothetical protein